MVDYNNRMTILPTLALEPKEENRFFPSKVRDIVENVVKKVLEDQEYDHH